MNIMDLLNRFLDSLLNGNYIIAFFAFVIILVFKAKAIYSFLDTLRSTKMKKIEELSKLDYNCALMKEHVNDCVNNEVFKTTTGINVEKVLREKLMHLQINSNGVLGYKRLKRALPYFCMIDNKLKIEINFWEYVYLVWNTILAIILTLMASFFMIMPSLSEKLSLYQTFISAVIGIVIYLVAGFVISETFSIRTARAIKLDVDKYNEDTEVKLTHPSNNYEVTNTNPQAV